jgi:hypothetical protein
MFTTAEQPLGDLVVPPAARAREDLADADARGGATGRALSAVAVGLAIGAVAHALAETVLAPVPCAARPSTGFVHRDGACRCFVGGPAPEFPRAVDPAGYVFIASPLR